MSLKCPGRAIEPDAGDLPKRFTGCILALRDAIIPALHGVLLARAEKVVPVLEVRAVVGQGH